MLVVVLQIVNKIRKNSKTHRKFKTFIKKMHGNDDTHKMPYDLSR